MSKYTDLSLVNENHLTNLHLPLTFSSRLRSAADLQRIVALAPRKKVTARVRLRKKHRRNTERQHWGRKHKQHNNWNIPRQCRLKKKVIIPKRKAVTSAGHLGQQKDVCIFFRSTNQKLFISLSLSLTLFSRERHMLYYTGNSPSG